ncbi:ATP-dependent RNA helicase HrpA [Marinomonas sp. 15G1-11]|uniref:ATP-dependent RNA helicase HrpA n=1 Tax=Marinomonas phaeophyticola TaxID=3004091 RepID=A0ABT4JV78_9GAMM|nr:ATP-dependent RNA helicase HrpA [Marinomonas sp. 15G1-11]MCZ2722272.1 ATP-dependent RNA helicase HrpA [Marinomonas sp. 15G1-11]
MLNHEIENLMTRDRHFIKRKQQNLEKRKQTGAPCDKLEKELQGLIEKSQTTFLQRQSFLPTIKYDNDLPVAERSEEIIEAISNNQVVIIAGETGSGKTTQLPKMCLQAGLGVAGLIGHTQPRRIAARSVADRISEELGVNLGEQVGFQIRFNDESSDKTLIKLMTDGILLAEIQKDRFLQKYDTIIIDEAHERSLNIDFLLGYLSRILPSRPDLKVIVTSATIDVERFSKHFNNAPIIEVSGRTYPVEIRYQPLLSKGDTEELDADQSMEQGILDAVEMLIQEERASSYRGAGDILVFLPGEREIRETAEILRKAELRNTEVLPLYARLSSSEQQRIFKPHSGRRIVLSTNVAETSLTVPGIRYVIDPGLARISRYSVRSKVQQLPIEKISQASANQRAGRCGRVAEGICVRLYDEEDFANRSEFTDPEIFRTNLSSVILKMASLKLGEVEKFPFVEMPDQRLINDGYQALVELGALQGDKLTHIGRQLATLPIDPKLGRMLIAAAEKNVLKEVAIIVSALSVQDPRERPQDKKTQSDQAHAQDKDADSDFIVLLNVWERYESQRIELSQNQLRQYCRKQFLNFMRMREWRDIHRQIHLACKALGFKEVTREERDYESIHRSLLAGLFTQVAQKLDETKEFLACRGRKLHLFPGSMLFKKPPQWVMLAEMVETSKLFGRVVAKIDPKWIEEYAAPFVKRQYFDPHWEKNQGRVVANEQVSLYGLILIAKRRIDYGQVVQHEAREIMIRSGLVEGEMRTKAAFFKHNQRLIESVENQEAKLRTRDILVDDEVLFNFYNRRVPETYFNQKGLEYWIKKHPDELKLTREDLINQNMEVDAFAFPDAFKLNDVKLPIDYAFEPGQEKDGATLKVPVGLLRQLNIDELSWAVPGFIREKCEAYLRALPKALRRRFVPIPQFVDRIYPNLSQDKGDLLDQLTLQIKRETLIEIPLSEWNAERLDKHLTLNVEVISEKGKVLGSGKDLASLQEQFAKEVDASFAKFGTKAHESEGLTRWPEQNVPEEQKLSQAGIKVVAYPALVAQGESVSVKMFDDKYTAQDEHRKGVICLLGLYLHKELKYLQKNMPNLQKSLLIFAPIGKKEVLLNDLLQAVLDKVFLDGLPLPRTEAEFLFRIEDKKNSLITEANEMAKQLFDVLSSYQKVAKRMKGNIPLPWTRIYGDIRVQLGHLIYPGFISETPLFWLAQFPRYFKGIETRLERFQNHLAKENAGVTELETLWDRYTKQKNAHLAKNLYDPELMKYRWMMEEYRISLFAQTVGTLEPISDKRLSKQWHLVKKLV